HLHRCGGGGHMGDAWRHVRPLGGKLPPRPPHGGLALGPPPPPHGPPEPSLPSPSPPPRLVLPAGAPPFPSPALPPSQPLSQRSWYCISLNCRGRGGRHPGAEGRRAQRRQRWLGRKWGCLLFVALAK